MKKPFQVFQPREKKSLTIDSSEIATDQEYRQMFLRYVNRGWLTFGIVTLVTLPLFPEQRGVFGYLVALTFPTYFITRTLNQTGRTWLAGAFFTISVNFGFYGLFLLLVSELGAHKAFETESTVWMLMGLAVLFAGAFVDKWAAPGLAVINALLLVGTRLTLAPDAQPRPAPIVFWMMMALTIWLYERTLGQASRRVLSELAERKQAEGSLLESEERYRNLFNTMEEGVAINQAVFDANGDAVDYVILDVNPAFERHSPYKIDEALGKRATDLYRMSPEFIRDWWRAHTQKTQAAQTEYYHEPTGRWFFITTTLPEQGRFATIFLNITERKKNEDEIRQRLAELQVLYEISNTISSEHDLNVLLRAIVENARKLLNSASSGMYLYLPASNDLELTVDTEPYIPFGSRLRLGEGVAGRVAQTRQPLRVDDYSTWESRSLLYEGTSLRAVLEVPMLYKGELIGVLTAEEVDDSTRKFTEADEHLLSLFASQAAGAIHSARLRQERIQRLSELEVLYQSGLALSRLVNPKTIAQKIIDLLDQKMDWHHTTIRLCHPENETLELLAFNQPGPNTEEQRSAVAERFKVAVARVGQGLSGWVAQHGVTVRSNDLKNDTRYVDTFPGLHSGLYVPLKIAERVIGVISIESEQADAFDESDERLTVTLAAQAAVAIHNAQLFDDLQRSNTDLTSAYDATIEGWSRAMDLRDKETEGHTLRVTEMTLELVRAMNIDESQLTHIRRGALLHDIGKLGVPDNILLNPDKLTDEEWAIMREHPTHAYEMLSSIAYLKPALDIPYCHHEKWDGTGYPRGLKGEQIPLVARIFAVVDVWDAVTSDRPYRPAWTREQALEYIKEQSGKNFDPQVVETFLKMIARK